MKIEDGGGTGKFAKVNGHQRLEVSSSVFSESSFVAKTSARTFIWTSSYSADTGAEVIYIKNTSKVNNLVIDKVTVNSVAAGFFEFGAASGTASGTAITGANTNLTSGNVADATALGNAAVTGVTLDTRIDLARTTANGRATMELQDVLIMGLNDAVTITYTGSTGIVDIIVTGYYLDLSTI